MNTEVLTKRKTPCCHCGELCADQSVRSEEKIFCCSGCKLVYEILEENDLGNYYCLEKQPGISFKKYSSGNRFEYLDDPSVVDRLTDFKSSDFTSVTLYIPNIHCTSCVWLLENLYKLDGGITKSSVNFLKRELSISFRLADTSLRQIVGGRLVYESFWPGYFSRHDADGHGSRPHQH